jgi:thymidylate kinase
VEERQKLLAEGLAKCDRCVISGSFCGWGDIFIPRFDLVIFVDTPTAVRIERLKEREYRHFGDRILPGGDMVDNHTEFIEWAKKYDSAGFEQRSRVFHLDWLKKISCPVLTVDGSQPLESILSTLEKIISR